MAVFIDSFMKRLGCKNQQELADKLGMSQGAVSAWGSGTRSPRYEDCVRLLQMGMTVEELFGEDVAKSVAVSNFKIDENTEEFDAKVKESMLRILSK